MKYGGNWKKYTSRDMDKLVDKLNSGSSIEELTDCSKYYKFYYERYNAVLSGFLGKYAVQSPDGERKSGYGLKVFSPIARGYFYNH